jgi:alcohol dehydrogenase (NADP+)
MMADATGRWRPADDAVDPALASQRRVAAGAAMPAIGLGTFGSDHAPHAAVAGAVKSAAAVGYRDFDCASIHGNEAAIRQSFEEIFASGPDRSEVRITSKLWNDKHGEVDVIASCRKSLAGLRLKYLDLFLMHPPFPNHHPPHCDVSAHNPNAVPYIHENYMRTWRKMEELADRGLVRHIGTSNYDDSEDQSGAVRCAHPTGGELDGAASALSSAGVLRVSESERHSTDRLAARGWLCADEEARIEMETKE